MIRGNSNIVLYCHRKAEQNQDPNPSNKKKENKTNKKIFIQNQHETFFGRFQFRNKADNNIVFG